MILKIDPCVNPISTKTVEMRVPRGICIYNTFFWKSPFSKQDFSMMQFKKIDLYIHS